MRPRQSNKNGQPPTVKPVTTESTFGKRRQSDSGTIIFDTKSAQLRYWEQTKGARPIE